MVGEAAGGGEWALLVGVLRGMGDGIGEGLVGVAGWSGVCGHRKSGE